MIEVSGPAVVEKDIEPMRIAGVRMKGRYSDCGRGFGKIAHSLGHFIDGKPMLLHYTPEYREADAEFEACMPVCGGKSVEGIEVRELPAEHCVCVLHVGPYDTLKEAYAKAFEYLKSKGYQPKLPTREVYLKGPGLLLKGSPKRYRTEIQIPIARGGKARR